MRPIVIIESPYAGATHREFDANLDYLRRCLRDSWDRGENPFASHNHYPLFLNEAVAKERAAGIEAGYAFWPFAKRIIFYIDRGMSGGMEAAHRKAMAEGLTVELRSITGDRAIVAPPIQPGVPNAST